MYNFSEHLLNYKNDKDIIDYFCLGFYNFGKEYINEKHVDKIFIGFYKTINNIIHNINGKTTS